MPSPERSKPHRWELSAALCPVCRNALRISLHLRNEQLRAIRCPTCEYTIDVERQRSLTRTLLSNRSSPTEKINALQTMASMRTSFRVPTK